jgi:hypothetical protein
MAFKRSGVRLPLAPPIYPNRYEVQGHGLTLAYLKYAKVSSSRKQFKPNWPFRAPEGLES